MTDNQISKLIKKSIKHITPNAIMYDNVKCLNCGYDGLVDMGQDNCPKCNAKALTWKENEEREVCR